MAVVILGAEGAFGDGRIQRGEEEVLQDGFVIGVIRCAVGNFGCAVGNRAYGGLGPSRGGFRFSRGGFGPSPGRRAL